MNASVAIQVLPTVTDDEEVIRIVDAVIDYIKSTGLSYYVGPCETSIEGDYDQLMEIVKNCQLVAAKAGCPAMHTYVKISVKALTNAVDRTYNCTCVNGYDEDSRNHWKCAANRGGCEPGESTGISEDHFRASG